MGNAARLVRCLALAGLALSVAAPALPAAPAFDPAADVVLVCTASGAAHLRPAQTPAQICAMFKGRIEAALGHMTRTATALPRSGNAIRIAISIPSTRSASAAVTTIARGKTTHWPEFAVDAMDTGLGTREISQLAAEVARAITQSSR